MRLVIESERAWRELVAVVARGGATFLSAADARSLRCRVACDTSAYADLERMPSGHYRVRHVPRPLDAPCS